jgi:hypothetical protein
MKTYTPKKKQDSMSTMIDQVLAKHAFNPVSSTERQLVDVVTFCEDPRYLNFLGQDPPINLWPLQRIVLKMFYRGSPGNEHSFLTDEEVEIVKAIGKEENLDYDQQWGGFDTVLEKYRGPDEFTHLLLVMGRRSSKTMLVSIIAAYEAYKLCQCPEGNPHKFYRITPDKPIHIINAATSEGQALDPLFKEIEARILRSPYFLDKVNHEASILGTLYILTDSDKRENIRRTENGITKKVPGSVILMSGHSNSASLRGHATICLLLDEFAHFQNTSGRSSGDEVLAALMPSMRQFGKNGKIVLLSDPRGKEGMFWKIFQLSQKKIQKPDGTLTWQHPDFLALQFPTWRINPEKEFSRDILEKTEKPKDPVGFFSTWGARFMSLQGAKFFDPLKINQCIDLNAQEVKIGDPFHDYYIHLDPGITDHNYALCMCHVVQYRDKGSQPRQKVIVDFVKFWRPENARAIDIIEIEKTIKDLCRKFRVVAVTFDSWQSAQTIQNLRMCGINAFETPFRSVYIQQIYGELRTLINEGEIVLYPHDLLMGELKELMFSLTNRGFKKFFDPKSDYPSDDCADALAGAAFQAMHTVMTRSLPKPLVVWTGRR